MSQKVPVIKKTKKSSYKPLSKLNEDSLTELKRVEKPEYTSRVFFHNISARAEVQNNVNVWFRHHQQTLALIDRQQKAVCKLMARVQRDRHRVKKVEYQRKQQEIRANMKRLQVELLQRRVIQKFRRNADKKMASRGLKSLASLRLTAQLRPESVRGFAVENSAQIKNAGTLTTPTDSENEADGEEGSSTGNVAEHHSCSQSHTSDQNHSGDDISLSEAGMFQDPCENKENFGHETNRSSSSSSHQQPVASIRSKSVIKPSNSDSLSPKDSETLESSTRKLPAIAGATPNLDSIDIIRTLNAPSASIPIGEERKEKCSDVGAKRPGHATVKKCLVFRQPGGASAVRCPALSEPQNDPALALKYVAFTEPTDDSARQYPEFMDSRVVEIKQSRPGSLTVMIRTRRGSEGITTGMTSTATPSTSQKLVTRPAHSDSATLAHSSTDSSQDKRDKTKNNREPSGHWKHPTFSSSATKHVLFPASHLSNPDPLAIVTQSGPSTDGKQWNTVKLMPYEEQPVSSQYVVTRNRTEEHARLPLHVARDGDCSPVDNVGKAKRSLANQVRLERQKAAKRRAKMLDNEMLTQYYRSTQGTLQPLQTPVWRRQFPLPTGRHRYQQGKLLRQEVQQSLERRRRIEQFISDLFTVRLGQHKPEPTGNTEEVRDNHLERLLKKMRSQQACAGAASIDWNSVEQLTKCQYLRIPRLEHQEEEGVRGMRMTSWTHAETRVKEAFH